MLVEILNVSLADLMPLKGSSISLAGEATPYRVSERLHAALKEEAALRGVMISVLLRDLRQEIHSSN